MAAEEEKNFDDAVAALTRNYQDIHADAYFFLRDVMIMLVKGMRKNPAIGEPHLKGPQIVDGYRRLVLREFGPLALSVLESWGIKSSEDIGKMVFRLIDVNLLRASEDDSIADFKNQLDFQTAFSEPFSPPSRRKTSVSIHQD